MADQQTRLKGHTGYSHADPFDTGKLPVSEIHTLHYEQYGKKDGKPVLFLHGGPGGATSKSNTQFFNPDVYRVVLFDQRGAGKSQPSAELRHNDSHQLVEDIERLRRHIGVSKWHVIFGGSWGSALALLYTQAHPDVVGGLVLRGIFTARVSETLWSRGEVGTAYIYPDAYKNFISHLPEAERKNPYLGYYKLLTSDDRQVQVAAAKQWNTWDITIGQMEAGPEAFLKVNDDQWSLSHARLEAHYMVNKFWLEEGQLLSPQNLARILHIPLTIVQGRYDIICPPRTAWELHEKWPGSKIFLVARAGHNVSENGVREKLIEVCDQFARLHD